MIPDFSTTPIGGMNIAKEELPTWALTKSNFLYRGKSNMMQIRCRCLMLHQLCLILYLKLFQYLHIGSRHDVAFSFEFEQLKLYFQDTEFTA